MPGDPRDYKVELSGEAGGGGEPAADGGDAARPFLSVLFRCCNVYRRVYRGPDGRTYAGRFPRCGAAITFRVGEGGTDSRSFVVE